MFGNVFLVLLLVGANGFFVAAEFALVKIRLSEIRSSTESGSKSARLVESIVMRLDSYLSACQLGITLASLGLGWVGEPLVARALLPLFHELGLPEAKLHYFAFPLAFATITFLHITVGEQVPKILAVEKPKPISFAVSLPLVVFYKVFQPFIWALNESSNLMLRLIGIRLTRGHEAYHSESELRLIMAESASGGQVSNRERLIMENVLDLEDKSARSAMLPRNDIVFLDRNDPIDEQLRQAADSGHTRLPLCDKDLEHVVGIIHVKDVFAALATGKAVDDLAELARDAIYFPETIALDRLLREFQRSRAIVSLLVDEYGVVSGLITVENILEELVGEIQDEFDSESSLIVERDRNTFEIDATCSIGVVRQELDVQLPELAADTIGGAVIEILGRIPEHGETITLGRHTVSVLAADARRIRKLLIEKKDKSTNEMDPPSDS
ncbi:MAG: hemolysin family protein [Candidatus Krumholzibacteria bacterium]|nr:hemolysin family protein [Candidatus Krumholzibacteria bacterium]